MSYLGNINCPRGINCMDPNCYKDHPPMFRSCQPILSNIGNSFIPKLNKNVSLLATVG